MIENEDSPRAESGTTMKRSNKTMVAEKAKVIENIYQPNTFTFILQPVKTSKSNLSSPIKEVTNIRKGKTAFIIDDSDSSDQELFNSIPDTLEEFISVKKSPAKKAEKKEEVFDLDIDVDISDDEEEESHEEDSPKKSKPVKRATKSKIVSEAKKTKVESIDTSVNPDTEATETTPKKKFKY